MQTTTENYRTSTNDEQNPTKDPRISTIVELRTQGATWGEIAQAVQLSPKGLYDLRQRSEYFGFLTDTLFPKTLKRLDEILDGSDVSDYKLMRAIDEVNKMIRALIPKQIESKSLHIEAQVDLNKRRELNRELMNRLDEDTRGKIRAALLELEDGRES